MKLFINFSEILGLEILDHQGQWIGNLSDIAMNPQGDIYPKASFLIISKGSLKKEYAQVSWDQIAYIESEVRLKIASSELVFQLTTISCEFMLKRDILDQQIVDTDNHKVERVNDIHLLRVENQIYAAHVDVGLRALVRRLEWTAAVDQLVKMFKPNSVYLTREELVPWKNTQLLPKLGRLKSVVKLDGNKTKLAQMPPTALVDIMQDLDVYARKTLFRTLEANMQAKVFADMPISAKEELMDQLDDKESAQLVSNIPADEATDILLKLPKENSQRLMRLMESETSKKLRKLLGFASDSAGGLMTMEYLYLKQEATVADAWNKIKENANAPVNAHFIYIVDDNNKFLGVTSVRRFVNEDPTSLLIKTCHPEQAFVYVDEGIEEAAILLERFKFSSIAVLNQEGILQGVITIDDVLEELISMAWSKYKEKL